MDFVGAGDFNNKLEIFLKNFPKEKDYIVWAVGSSFQDLLDATGSDLRIKYCVDSDPKLHGSKVNGIPVLSPKELLHENKQTTKVIVTPAGYTQHQIVDELKNMGYDENAFCYANDLGMIWNLVLNNSVVLPECNIAITAVCTLRCQACTEYLTLFPSHKSKHSPIEDVKQNLDLLFGMVDRVTNLGFGTGEILLHPNIIDILKYIAQHYSEQYRDLTVFTNGTYVPKAAIIDAIAETNTFVRISNYEPVIGSRSKIDRILEAFIKAGISPVVVNQFGSQKDISGLWSDLGSPFEPRGRGQLGNSELFKKCGFFCRFLWNKKIYHCAPLAGAVMGDLYSAEEGDYFDLSIQTNKSDLVKFYVKHNEAGYVSFCDRCDGFGIVANSKTIPAGVQAK